MRKIKLVVAILGTFAVMETIARLSFPKTHVFYPERFDALTSYKNKPDQRGWLKDYPLEGTSYYIETPTVEKKASGKILVLLLGSDETIEMRERQDDLSLKEMVLSELKESYRSKIQLVNLAVRGSTSFQQHLYYLTEGRFLNPDIVIQITGISDGILGAFGYLGDDFDTPYTQLVEKDFNLNLYFIPRGLFNTIYFEIRNAFSRLKDFISSFTTFSLMKQMFFMNHDSFPPNFRYLTTSQPSPLEKLTQTTELALDSLARAVQEDKFFFSRLTLKRDLESLAKEPFYMSNEQVSFLKAYQNLESNKVLYLSKTDLTSPLTLSNQGRKKLAQKISQIIIKEIRQ